MCLDILQTHVAYIFIVAFILKLTDHPWLPWYISRKILIIPKWIYVFSTKGQNLLELCPDL